jgi:hypothetical protein
MASVRQKKLQAAARSLHETQTNVLAVYERNREIEELPPGLETGYTNRRKRGARTDEDCINEVCELISRGITASAATEFVGLPWSTWHAWIRRDHCQAKEKHDLAYDFHLEAMTDKIHHVYLEIKAKREKALEAYYKRYDAWVDACNKLGKDDRLPREPQYRGPAEWELKAAEDQAKAWQWHLELRHTKFQRKHQLETTQNISRLLIKSGTCGTSSGSSAEVPTLCLNVGRRGCPRADLLSRD